ncbi:hypothetical protein JCM8097_003196 [Rhodosporidiobolus ruineniae]
MSIPEPSQCLFATSAQNKTFQGIKAFLTVKGTPARVFGMDEGPGWVSAFAQGSEGSNFSVTIYDGREGKSGAKGQEIELFFGEKDIENYYFKPSDMADIRTSSREDKERFVVFDEYRINKRQVRPYQFAKIATTDDSHKASCDDDFLNSISVIKLTVRQIKQAPRDPKEKKKKKKKKAAWEESSESEGDDPVKKADKRLLDEKTDKGQFALNASYGDIIEKPLPKRKDNGETSAPYWRYQYVHDEVDFTFTFRVRSSAWVKNFLDPDRERTPPREVHTPPRELDGELYLDMDEEEAAVAYKTDLQNAAKATQAGDGKTKSAKGKARATSLASDRTDSEDEDESDEDEEEEKEEEEDEDDSDADDSDVDDLAPEAEEAEAALIALQRRAKGARAAADAAKEAARKKRAASSSPSVSKKPRFTSGASRDPVSRSTSLLSNVGASTSGSASRPLASPTPLPTLSQFPTPGTFALSPSTASTPSTLNRSVTPAASTSSAAPSTAATSVAATPSAEPESQKKGSRFSLW